MGFRVGVDIGGTFTDFAVFDETEKVISSMKVFSRPDNPGEEVMTGIKALNERYGIPASKISYFTHGTTVGVNTVIQRKGLKLALFVTEHFRDVLELGRLKTPDMYDLLSKRPAPLIKRECVFGIPGRLNADGSVHEPLDHEAAKVAIAEAQERGCEGVIIALLHSYANPEHERELKELVQGVAPDLPVFCSSETWPIIREYERTITAVIGGYVQPRVAGYLDALQQALNDAGVPAPAHLTKSNGGIMTAEQGKQECVQMILSGTASGVIGAAYLAKTAGIKKCMSFDMGGTSADIALIIDGEPQYGVGERIGEFQVFIPSVSVTSIGEGGGSIAWVDTQGVLKVGPESAGSNPGPACYGLGGTEATITDAFLACGLIGHAEIGYDAVKVDAASAREAVGKLAHKLDLSVEETAERIIQVSISGMFADTSALVSRFGINPQEFSMLAFGGAGPMTACFLARELGVREVVVPPTPGVLSALGGLIADLKNDFIKVVYQDLTEDLVLRILGEFEELTSKAEKWLYDDQGHTGKASVTYSAEVRYKGQSFEVETPLNLKDVEREGVTAIARAFHQEHERIYGHADQNAALQIISIRVVIHGEISKPEVAVHALEQTIATPITVVRGRIDNQVRDIALYRREELRPGHMFTGPAVISQEDCTTVVPMHFNVKVDEFANLRIAMGDE